MPRIGVVGGGAVLILAAIATIRSQTAVPLRFAFTDIAARAGLTARTVYGGEGSNRYLVETTGSGAAAFDYDGDGWIDIFLVNGSTLEGFPVGKAPTSHLYRNRRDGTFEDVTAAAGLALAGWGQGACAADYDNDGDEDLAVTFWGRNRLMRNRGDGTFEDATQAAGLETAQRRWGTGCAFLDYDRDGQLDLFVANYIDFDVATAPVPESGLCRYKGLAVACGPPGLTGAKNVLYRNVGGGTIRRRVRRLGDHRGQRHLQPRRQHARLRRRRLGRSLRRQRLEPERALSQQPRRHADRHRAPGRLRLQPGRPAAGGHGRRRRRLRSRRPRRHLQDQLRRRHLDAVRQHGHRPVRRPDVRRRHRPQHALARVGRGVRRLSIWTGSSTCSW